jgi:putative aminopeptidase FrvX
MIKDLSEELRAAVMIPGISGYEDRVREYVKKHLAKEKELETDAIGNLILNMGGDGNAPSIAIVAHMDEVGFVVSNLLDNGTLKFKKIGGIEDQVLPARAVEIHTSNGRTVPGIIGFNAPHLKLEGEEKKTLSWDRMCIDLGTRSRKETEKLGIKLLDQVTFKKDFFLMNNNVVCSRALDNRVGVTTLLKVYDEIKNRKLKGHVCLVWSVQEEIGLRGARVIANTMDFDIVIAVDTYSTTDAPGLGDFFEPVKLGKGPVLRMVDARVIASPRMREIVTKIAKKARIPIQFGVTGGSTDGMAMQESGAATLPIGIPMRYTHSPTECIHLDDMQNLIKLINAIINGVQTHVVNK